jgi:DNA-binding NtrC family response regulator
MTKRKEPANYNLKDHKQEVIANALIDSDGYVSQAAEKCGMSRKALHHIIAKDPDLADLVADLRDTRRAS